MRTGRGTRKTPRLFAVTVVLLLVAAACGDDDDTGTTGTEAPGTTAATETTSAPDTTAAPETTAPAETTEAPVAEGVTYKIGFVASATGPGSSLGIPEANTAEMLAEQWADGITGPDGVHHAVEVIVLDSESNPDVGAAAVNRLINEDEVDVLVAGTLSGNALAMAPLAEEAHIPMISMGSARSIVETDGAARHWIFKTPQENGHSARWQADYLTTMGITTVCYLFENSGFGQDTLNNGQAFFPDAGIEIVFNDTFERSDTEFPQMPGVQASGCEAAVVGAIPPGASMVTAALRDFVPDIPVIHGHGVCNSAFIDLAPEATEGVPLPCGRLLVAAGLPDDDPQKAILVKYIDDYTAFTGGEPVSTFGGHAWDALMWAFEGLGSLDEGASLEDRRTGVRDYVEGSITNWPGTGGVFNITTDDHLGLEYTGLTFVRVEGGGYAYFPPEDW